MEHRLLYVPPGIENPQRLTKKAQLHVHTTCSDGRMSPEQAVDASLRANLNALAITDHRTVKGGHIARNYAAQYGFDKELQVLVGSEITTYLNGKPAHIIGLDIEDDIQSENSPEWTIEQIREQNGLVIFPHPNITSISSLSLRTVHEFVTHPDAKFHPHAIEVLNGTATTLQGVPLVGRRVIGDEHISALEYFQKHEHDIRLGAPLVNGDVHSRVVDMAVTGYANGDVRDAITSRKTVGLLRPEIYSVWHTIKEVFTIERANVLVKAGLAQGS